MKNKFKLNRVAASVGVQFRFTPATRALLLATAGLTAIGAAHANGGGFGMGSDGITPVQTFYANTYVSNSPSIDGTTNAVRGLRKFVDTLPGVPGVYGGANNLGQYMPTGVADTTSYANSDYYEIAVVEYTERMHSDLAKATTLRGYVQIDPFATDTHAGLTNNVVKADGSLTNATAPAGSEAVALINPSGSPVMIMRPNGAGGFISVQAYAVHKPHFLGPVIVAQRGQAVRIKFYNALPVGRAVTNADGSVSRNGDLFLPVDETLIGSGYGPDGMTKYSQNRVAIHWHGGDTPWISDGTPHQWYTPAGETGYTKGDSQANVPDMADPGPGAETLYFPNNLSGRLMFYHDHAVAMTRLNVYAGMAAGYLIQDPVEQILVNGGTIGTTTIAAGTVPGDMIPLVIQDRTFVPNDIAQEDAYWDTQHWGTEGDLWFPHVYETNQDPASVDGTNPVGRWDYGPWFWPVFPAPLQLPTGAYGDVTTTPEGFMDTAIVNGTAYPTTTVDPKAYRLRILNAANDRMINLGFYVADASVTTPDSRHNTEVKMVPFTGPNSPTTVTYACPDGVTAGQRVGDYNANGQVKQVGWTESGPTAAIAATATTTGTASASVLYPNSFPCAGGLQGTGWGTQNNYPGGVPDPTLAGPDIISIGTEGGILPNPVVIPSTPINYEFNKRSVTVLNVMERGLFIGTAERADVIVDFSKYAGKTLILFNDSPAPLPAGDPRIDYYTGAGDQTGAGGAMDIVPGFGPNTRTVMQFKVCDPSIADTTSEYYCASGMTAVAPAFNVAALQAALPAAYAASQEAPLIPESAYNNAFGTNSGDNFATIYNGSSIQPNFVWTPATTTAQTLQSISVTGQGVGYTVAPNVVLSGGGLAAPITINPVAGSAGAQVAGGKVISVILDNATKNTIGSQLRSAPKVTLVSNSVTPTSPKVGGGATAQGFTNMTSSLPVKNKAIQELFDPSYGRMNATLGVELPFTSPLNQTTIPLGYIDPVTEKLNDGEVQIWKITHNGVDSHPVHFHLVNLQVLNRVGWDGTIKPPYDDEQGWKETIKMNPLEDIYVAVKPRAPMLPFGIADSVRLMDPSQPAGSITGFTQVDPTTGVAPIDPVTGLTTQISNQMVNYGWEYVWHCHILGHEENDFMRPIVFNFGAQLPSAPTTLAATTAFAANTVSDVVLTWADPTPVAAATTRGNKQNEIGFKISRAPAGSSIFTSVGTAKANVTTFTDKAAPATTTGYTYQVQAYNAVGDGPAASVLWNDGSVTAPTCAGVGGLPTATTGANAMVAPVAGTVSLSGTGASVNFTDSSINETGFRVYRAPLGGGNCSYTLAATSQSSNSQRTALNRAVSVTTTGEVAGNTYTYAVVSYLAVTGRNATTYYSPVVFETPNLYFTGSLNVTGLTATADSMTQVTLSWSDNSVVETGYTITRTGGAAFTPVTLPANAGTGTVSYVDRTAVANTAYTYKVTATGSPTNGLTASVSVTTPVDPALTLAAPSNVMVQMTGANTAQVTFNDLATKETLYVVQVSTDSGKSWGDGTVSNFTQAVPAYVATRGAVSGTGSAATITVNNANLTLASGVSPYLFRVAPAIGASTTVSYTDAAGNPATYTGANITTMGAWGNIATLDLSGQTIIAPATGLSAGTPTTTSIPLTWVDNANNNATYSVDMSTDGINWTSKTTTLAGTATSYTATGLNPGVTYQFRVKAVSLGKNASPYATVSANTLFTPLASAPSLVLGAGPSVTATWTAVTGAAGYLVQTSVNNGATWTTPVSQTATTANVTVAANNKVMFKVAAVSASGVASAYTPSTALNVVAPTVPAFGTTTAVTATGFTLNWAAVTGASTYTVTGTGASATPVTGTSMAIAGLTGNTSYSYTITATNVVGSSAASVAKAQRTLPDAPTALGVSAATVTATGLTLNWTAPVGGATGYTVQRSTNGTNWTSATGTINGTSMVVTGLTGSTTYYFQVIATNATGNSLASASVTQTTAAAPIPLTPTGAAATQGLSGNPITANVTWTAPANATSYNLVWSTSATGLNAVTGTTPPASGGGNAGVNVISAIAGTPYTFAPAGVATGTMVYFKLQAVNATGSSAWTAAFNSTVR